jgi:segregation and condensation protein A
MTSPEPAGVFRVVESGSPYAVKLPLFEGPLDLLLHLIRLNEVEITDIPIARIGEQYLAYLDLMRELDLDIAGEYLLMAATLAWIKSRMLLPLEGAEEEGEGPDPRAELAARLLEYQRYKEAAGELGERRLLGRDVFPAWGLRPELPPEGEREIEVGLIELLEAFRHALKAAGPSGAAHKIEAETITVHERMLVVMNLLELRGSLDFEEALVAEDGRPVSRALVVATFLAVLELTRLVALRLYQGVGETGVPQGPIHLRRVESSEGSGWDGHIAAAK